ncbi:MAG: glycerophosphodiester phosphodiesterase family protein, partial [Acidimicrobiia bacterium]
DGSPLPDLPHVALQVPRSFGDTVVVDSAFVERAHEAGIAVHVLTIDDRDEMEELCALGVDGIITDRPSLLTEVLAEEGLTYYR